MRRSAPNMQEQADRHTNSRAGKKHDRHLPGNDLQQARLDSVWRDSGKGFGGGLLVGLALAQRFGKQIAQVLQAVAVRGQAVQADGLVGGGEDAEEGEHDAAVPGCADGPGGDFARGEDRGP